jgi:nickel transport protein
VVQGILKQAMLVGIFLLVILGGPVSGHRVSIFAYVENGRIYTESFFLEGDPVAGGTVEILDSQHQKLAEGVTDKEGKCVLPVPKVDDLTIVVNAQLGHRSIFLLKKQDLGE